MTVAEVVRGGTWRDVEVPERVSVVPTMLSPDETRLLYALALAADGQSRIVDAGCFLGGSTVALAQGLRDSGSTARIDVYDRFTAEGYTIAERWFEGTEVARPGDSFRRIFDQNLAGFQDLLTIHEGDITKARFDAPIQLLFLDVLKTWPVNDAVTAASFSQLAPGAVVVQQDWGSGSLPWVTLTMERLAPWFEMIGDVGPSRIYVLREPIPSHVLATGWRDLDPAWMIATYERVVGSLEGTARGLQAINMARLLMRVRDPLRGRALLDETERTYADDPVVAAACERAKSWAPRWLVPLMWLDVVGFDVRRRWRAISLARPR